MKRNMLALAMSALMLASAVPGVPVSADGQKVVTLGADLSEEQKNAILRYFGVAGQSIQTLTITNQDERNHLGSYVPLEQIGTRTYSCALVCPTTSGGIQVKTANLSWVTSNMIATTLSTSGVVNCDVLAASPFEVSGTGALTGILMAYESASGEKLDETKKEIATQEMIATTTIANTVGQQQATEIVNDTKMQVIQGNQVNEMTSNDIDIIVNEVAEEKQISLTDEDRELLTSLLEEIAAQDYDYDEMKETLERVEVNVNNTIENTTVIQTGETSAADQQSEAAPQTEAVQNETPETLAPDSILMNTDESALGDTATFDATDTSALDETEVPAQQETAPQTDAAGGFEITSSDEYTDTPETTAPSETPADVQSETPADGSADVQSETPADGSADVQSEAPADGQPVTLNLEMIPLDEFVLAPVTSESTAYEVYQAGMDELTVSFERGDIIAGSGTVSLYNAADSSLVETINMSDPKKVSIVPLDDEELLDLGWSSGYKAVISLTETLKQDTTYFVSLSQDAFATADGIGTSEATPDSYTWIFQTAPYGFRIVKPEDGFAAGGTAAGEILMDGTAAGYACIENADASMISFDQTEFWANGRLNATFVQPGETTFQVSFYDVMGGTLLYTVNYTVEVR